MKLAIIIVSYNVRHYLSQCIDSVGKATRGTDSAIYVVDNHSHDGTVDAIRRDHPQVRLTASPHNLGFARANNIAIRNSESQYVLLLNPDTIVTEDSLRQLLDFMDTHPRAGACGLRMLTATGTPAPESRRGTPSPMTAFYKMTGLCQRFPLSRRFGRYYMGWLPWDRAARIDIVSGACCMLRREALGQTGLLDEDFFMYGEDIDLSFRLLKAGWENWYVPATILHYKGESTQHSSFRYVHVFYGAMLIFLRKHYHGLSVFLSLPIKAAIIGSALCALTRTTAAHTRHVLGFFRRHRQPAPHLIIIAPEESLRECRRIADCNGLRCTTVEGDEDRLPEGHLSIISTLDDGERYSVAYDISAYSYSTILGNFNRQPRPNITIATYDPRTRTIITPTDTYHS